jgi:hypothetical protein
VKGAAEPAVGARVLVAWFLCTLVAWLGAAAPALAQRANRTYAGAFGAQPDEERIQGLDLSGAFLGAYDHDVYPMVPSAAALDPRLKESGPSAGVAGTLAYDRDGERTQFTASGSATARGYASSPDLSAAAYQAASSVNTSVTSRLVMNARAAIQYSPFFDFAPFLPPGSSSVGPIGPGFAQATVAEPNIGLDGAFGLMDNLTKQTSVFATLEGRDWRVPDAPENNLRTWRGTAGVRHRLTQALGLHFQYSRDQNQYAFATATPFLNQSIDAGVDYGDTLTFSRRTALSFTTSTSATRYLDETHYRVNGSARLTRGFGRTWSSWVGYNRDTEFRMGFAAPLLSDSIDAGVGGQLSWRLRWSTDIGYTKGTIGFGSDRFHTYSATSRLDFALNRSLALFGQYGRFNYAIPPGSSTLDLVPRFSRDSVVFGLSAYLPLIHDVRAPREP